MVEQSETYKWEVTLPDGTVKKEADGIKFDIDWFEKGNVKQIKLAQEEGDKYYSVSLENGQFDRNGSKHTPSGLGDGSLGDYKLVYFKRQVVRVDENGPLGNKTAYHIGYEKGSDKKVLRIQPKIGMVDESVEYVD